MHRLLAAGVVAGVVCLGGAANALPSPSAAPAVRNGDVAFASNGEIVAVAADGSRRRNVSKTATLVESDPVYSPDGRFLAWSSSGPSETGIMVAHGDGTGAFQLVGADEPAWAVDGTRIAFISFFPGKTFVGGIPFSYTGRALHVRDLRTGATAFVPTDRGFHPTWSPDGTTIAFGEWAPPFLGGSPNSSIRVGNADGSGTPTRLTDPSASNVQDPAWSPDGTKLAVAVGPGPFQDSSANLDVYTIDARTGAFLRRLTATPRREEDPAWSPDGARIVFSRGDGLWTIDADGGNERQLTSGPDAEPTWQVRPPVSDLVTGAGAGGASHVTAFAGDTLSVLASFYAYGQAFTGGVRVAEGDVDDDGVADLVTAAGPGGGPHIRVFEGTTQQPIRSFFAYDPAFAGGVFVAAGDVDGDGFADVVTGAGAGGGPHVKVFSGRDGSVLRSFYAYDQAFAGGVRVAAGDLDGDGHAEVVTAPGPGGGSLVKVFSGATGDVARSFAAYGPGFTGGAFVAVGDIDGDFLPDIVTGADAGGGPHVQVFSGKDGSVLQSFYPYDAGFAGGARVAAGDVDGDGHPDLVTAAGPGGGPHVQVLDTSGGGVVHSFFAYDPAFRGGAFVAAADIGTIPALLTRARLLAPP